MLQRPVSVLVVDDHALSVTAIRQVLEKDGFAVSTADDGERALDLLRDGKFDIVLLDLLMPGMDGLEVLHRLAPARDASSPKIIMLSAVTESDQIIEALGLGASDYVTKPVDYPVLLARIKTLLAQSETERLLRDARARLESGIAVLKERIAEQAVIEESLRERERGLDAILSNIVEGIITIDDKGLIQSFNPPREKMFGYAADAVIGKNVSILMPEPDRGRHDGYIANYLKTGEGKIIGVGFREIEARRQDGSRFPGELAISEVVIDGKRRFIGTIRDITRRKKAERELRARSEQLQMVSDLGHQALRDPNLKKLFAAATKAIAKVLSVEMCKVLLLEPQGDRLRLVSGVGWKRGLVGKATVDIGLDSQAGYTLQSKDVVIVEDLRTESRFNGPALLTDHGVVSGLSVIIGDRERPLGVFGVHTKRRRAFSDDEVNAMHSVASLLASVIDRDVAGAELELRENRLRGAIESLQEGFALFDADDRLVAINDVYRRINPNTQKLFERGSRFEDLIRANVKGGRILEAVGREEKFLAERLEQHRDPKDPLIRRHSDGNTYMVKETRTPEGGVALTFNDVTALVAAQQNLAESKERFRAVVDHMPYAVYLKDLDGRYILVNEAFEDWYGLPIREARDKTVFDLFPTDLAEQFSATDQEVLESRQMIGTNAEIRKVDGTVQHIDVVKFPIFDAAGGLVGLCGVNIDITERRRAEEALRESEARTRRILESAGEGIYGLDKDGRTTFVNPAACAILGYTADEIMGAERMHDLIHHSHPDGTPYPRDDCHIYAASRDGKVRRVTDEVLWRKDGTPVPVEYVSTPIAMDGKFVGAVVTFTDITERKRAEAALRESEAQLRLVTNALPVGIAYLDVDQRYRYINRELSAWYACEPADVVGKTVKEVLGAAAYKKMRGPLETALAAEAVTFDATVTYPDGNARDVDVRFEPQVDGDGEVRGVVGLVIDITERSIAEAQLVQADKLATLGRMASNIAHEMNQPLNIIRMAAESSLMGMDDDTLTPGTLRRKLGQIDGQAQRMAEIIDHMRVLAREDKSRVEGFSPLERLQTACDFLDEQFAAVGIGLQRKFPASCRLVSGRPVAFEQVVLNLLANARDAVETTMAANAGKPSKWHGKVTVRLSDDKRKKTLAIAVTDNGGGISDEDLARVFDPFFTTKDEGVGTGLGLSISQGIIQSMGGTLEAANTRSGTRFTITLPVSEATAKDKAPERRKRPRQAKAAPPAETGAAPEHGDSPSVLVVDDEELAVQFLAEHLERKGFRVVTAGDGAEALAVYEAAPTDAVVTDLRMPKMDGNELIRRLREVSTDLPIFVTTGHTNIGDDKNAVSQGATAVLKKPVSLRDITRRLQAATGAGAGDNPGDNP